MSALNAERSGQGAATTPPDVVLVVDDDPLVRELLTRLIVELPDARVVTAGDSATALRWCEAHEPDVVITDYRMPGMSGTALIAALRQRPATAEVPIMMITASDDRAVRVEALHTGATDVLTKPIDAAEVRARTRNMLAIRRGQRIMAQRSSSLEEEVRRATAAIAARERETILTLSKAAEYRDWETGSHIVRVSLYARIVARELSLPPDEQEILLQAAPMHDLGKIGIPDAILLKPGELDPVEYEMIKEHTIIGHRILSGSSAELLQAAAEIALNHHERFDGSGYPRELIGEEIPLHGRIVAVADTFDALTSSRPYKAAWAASLAWSFLEQHAGSRFDPACVTAFLRARQDADQIRAAFPDGTGGDSPRGRSATAGLATDEM